MSWRKGRVSWESNKVNRGINDQIPNLCEKRAASMFFRKENDTEKRQSMAVFLVHGQIALQDSVWLHLIPSSCMLKSGQSGRSLEDLPMHLVLLASQGQHGWGKGCVKGGLASPRLLPTQLVVYNRKHLEAGASVPSVSLTYPKSWTNLSIPHIKSSKSFSIYSASIPWIRETDQKPYE